jgi:hypothetical protein
LAYTADIGGDGVLAPPKMWRTWSHFLFAVNLALFAVPKGFFPQQDTGRTGRLALA